MCCRDSSNLSETFANCGTVCSLHKRHSCLQITSVQQRWGPICFSLCLLLSPLGWISAGSICSISRLVFWEAQLTELRSSALVCLADLGKHCLKGIHLHLSYRLWRTVKNSCTPMLRTFQGCLSVSHCTYLQVFAAMDWAFVMAGATDTMNLQWWLPRQWELLNVWSFLAFLLSIYVT